MPAAANSRLAPAHFWLAAASGVGMVTGLYILLGGNPAVEPLVAVSSIAFLARMLLFAWIALPAIWKVERPPHPMRAGDGAAA